jgi:hypothetical protein
VEAMCAATLGVYDRLLRSGHLSGRRIGEELP